MIYKDCQQEVYYVYILLCSDDSFYIGLTNELLRRFDDHCNGVYPTCYTYQRRPIQLMYYETIPFHDEAIQREKQLKGWSRAKKRPSPIFVSCRLSTGLDDNVS